MIRFLSFILVGFTLMGCTPEVEPSQKQVILDIQRKTITTENSVPIYPKLPPKTADKAKRFNLELPYRCSVDWDTQRIVKTEPFDRDKLEYTRADKGDALPKFLVKDFSVKKMETHHALMKLLQNTGIDVYAPDPMYPKINLPDTSGKMDQILDIIAELSGLYYHYDARTKRLTLSREAKWRLAVPFSEDVIIAVLDALRGSNVKGIVVDWEDKVLYFKGDKLVEKSTKQLINQLSDENTLIAFDLNIYRLYPKNDEGVNWMDLLKSFDQQTIKASVPGIMGRLVVTGPNLNTDTFASFIRERANMVLISQGTFVLPNRWQGRFDVGRCSLDDRLETDLNVLAEPSYSVDDFAKDHLDTQFVLRTKEGDITSFDVPARLGENYLIIGVPTHSFVEGYSSLIPDNAELAIFVSPRIINIVDMRVVEEEK